MTLRVRTTGWLDVDVAAEHGTTLAVVGPNGAGKTTLLRTVAGLPSPATAEVRLDGRDLTSVPAHQRRVGWVPQAGVLFPHLSVLDNAAYALRAAGHSRTQARAEAGRWLARLDVEGLADRRTTTLSGGEAQRVALARAFAGRPALLLLDEPLAALDTATRAAVRSLLRRHLTTYDGVCLFVTHDLVEAVALADRVLVLEGGRLVQDASPAEVTRAPRTRWVAQLFGWNALSGTSTGHGLRTPSGVEVVSAEPLDPGRPALACVAPGSIAVHTRRPSGSPRNAWPGRATEVTPAGSRLRVRVALAGGPTELVAEVTPEAVTDLGLAEGREVWVSVKATEVQLALL